jgi:hypothetical protein
MSAPYAWPKSAVEIVNEIDDEMQIGWDTDSNINILTGFIEEHCDPAEFAAFVRKCAESDIANGQVDP